MCLAASAQMRVLAQFMGDALGNAFTADRFLGTQLFGQPIFQIIDMPFVKRKIEMKYAICRIMVQH